MGSHIMMISYSLAWYKMDLQTKIVNGISGANSLGDGRYFNGLCCSSKNDVIPVLDSLKMHYF